MSSATHTSRYVVEDIASKALADIRGETQKMAQSMLAAKGEIAGLKYELRSTIDATDEVVQKIRDARNKMVEFGFSAREVATGLDLIYAAAEATGEPISLTALRMEELAIETQNAQQAFELFPLATRIAQDLGGRIEDTTALAVKLAKETGNVEEATKRWTQAQQLAIRTGERAETALENLNAAARGSTAALRDLSLTGQLVAAEIDKISDPALRSKVALQETNREAQRGQGGLEKLNDQYQMMRVSFARLGPAGQLAKGGVMAVVAAVVALTAATAKYVQGGLKLHIERTHALKKAKADLTKAEQDLQAEVGKVAAEAGNLDGVMRDLTGVLKATKVTVGELGPGIAGVGGNLVDLASAFGLVMGPVGIFIASMNAAYSTLKRLAQGIREAHDAANKGQRDSEKARKRKFDRDNAEFLMNEPKDTTSLERQIEADIRSGKIKKGKDGIPLFDLSFDDQGRPTLKPGEVATTDLAAKIAADFKDVEGPESGGGGGGGGGKLSQNPRALLARMVRPFERQLKEREKSRKEFLEVVKETRQLTTKRLESNRRAEIALDKRLFQMQMSLAETKADLAVQAMPGMGGVVAGGRDLAGLQDRVTRELDPLAQSMRRLKDAARIDTGVPKETQDMIDGMDRATQMTEGANQAWTDLANGGISIATNALGDFISQMAAGSFSAKGFAVGLLGSFGQLFRQTGTGLILLGSSVASIAGGVPNPGALIGWGVGLTVVGAAMEGFASRATSGASGGAATASAVQQGFQTSTDRLLQDRNRDRALEVNLKVEGFRQAVWQTVNEGADLRQIPALK